MNIKKTALYELHKKHNAKFVEFAGYSMPIQYSEGIVKEHNITRNKSGIFDVSHMGQLFIKYSNDITDKLQEILPTDLKNLKINQSKYSFLMKENGGIYDDLIITRMKDQYMIILNAACKQNDLQIIKNKLNDQNLDMNNNLSLVAIQGPESKTILENVVSNVSKLKFMNGENFSFKNNEIYITRSGYTGEDGFEISLPNKVAISFVEELISKGSTFSKNEIFCDLKGEHSSAFVNGIFSLNKNKHHEIKAKINHLVENTKSYQLVKSVLENKSRSVYQGKIYVDSKAQKTDGYQLSKAILVDETTEFNAKPELEIYADDVKCSHGSTSGNVDENSIHYLMTRGLTKKEATQLLINGFLKEIISDIKSDTIKKFVENKLEFQIYGY